MEGTKKTNKTNKNLLIGLIALIAVAAIFTSVFFIFREKPVAGNKQIVIEVLGKSGQSTRYDVSTDAEYLRQAMEEADGLTFSGTESEYGLMVDTVNGDRADYGADGAYWSFYVNDEYCNYGIDTQPIENGDKFSIKYTVDVTE